MDLRAALVLQLSHPPNSQERRGNDDDDILIWIGKRSMIVNDQSAINLLQAVLWMAVKHQDKRAIQVCDVCEATSERRQQHNGTLRETGIWDMADIST